MKGLLAPSPDPRTPPSFRAFPSPPPFSDFPTPTTLPSLSQSPPSAPTCIVNAAVAALDYVAIPSTHTVLIIGSPLTLSSFTVTD